MEVVGQEQIGYINAHDRDDSKRRDRSKRHSEVFASPLL